MSDDAALLEAAFGRADERHYRWQTAAPYVAERERELCEAVFLPLGRRVLDVGCGQGATLFHLGEPAGAVGADLFAANAAFAARALPRCRFVAASAYELPFAAESFDQVIARDLVHHLGEPARFVAECARVLAAGGRIDLCEPCGYNPLIAMHALLKPVERGELRSTPALLTLLVAPAFEVERIARFQALPLHRLLFHPDLGAPGAGAVPWIARAVRAAERAAQVVLPRATWAYIHLRARRR